MVAKTFMIGEALPKFILLENKLPTDANAIYETVIAFNKHGEKVIAWLEQHP